MKRLILLLVLFPYFGICQMTRIDVPNSKAQANVFVNNGKLLSKIVNVAFIGNTIQWKENQTTIRSENVSSPQLAKIQKVLQQLRDRFGEYEISRRVKSSPVGVSSGINRRTGEIVQFPDLSQYVVLRFKDTVSVSDVIDLLRPVQAVLGVSGPLFYCKFNTPNDPELSSGNQWGLGVIQAIKAWDINTGNANTRIAIVDEGVDQSHEDLTGKFVGGEPGYGDHGTEVAGVAGARTNNSTGVASLGWNVSLMNYDWDLIDPADAINRAKDSADVINMSWGVFVLADLEDMPESCQNPQHWIYPYSADPVLVPYPDPALQSAIQSATQNGVVCVAAAGNLSENYYRVDYSCDPARIPYKPYPAGFSQVIAVSATHLDGTEKSADWWNYDSGQKWLDVSAPGYLIRVTTAGGGYSYDGGTSFASPLVSALASLIISVNPNLNVDQIKNILTNATDKIDATNYPYDQTGWSDHLGYGRINAHKALLAAAAYNSKTYTYWAGYNNERILLKDGSGYLHNVVNSGGEVIYRRSTNGGSSWTNVRVISADNGANEAPSLALLPSGGSTYLQAVWERKLSNYYYELWYSKSTDAGVTWSDASILPGASNVQVSYNQSNSGGGPGPTPVIVAMNGSNTKILCVWAQYDALKYKTTNDLNSWSGTVSSVPYSTSYDPWHPSLSTYGLSPQKSYLIYGERYNGIWSQYFDANNGSWSSRVSAGSGAYERYASMALYGDAMYGVWSRYNNSQYQIRYRYGSYNSWSGYMNDFSVPNLDSFLPAITGYIDQYWERWKIMVVWFAYRNGPFYVYQETMDEWGYWNGAYLLEGNACYPNVTQDWDGSGTPRMIWTNIGSSPYPPPYTVVLSSQYLTKSGQKTSPIVQTRGIEMHDKSSGVTYWVRLKGLPFKKVDPRSVGKLNLASALDLLETESFAANEGQKMAFEIETGVFEPDTVSNGELRAASNRQSYGLSIDFDVISGESKIGEYSVYSGELTGNKIDRILDLSTFSSTAIKLKPRFTTSIKDTPDVEYLVVGSSEATDLEAQDTLTPKGDVVPIGFSVSNYPNPSNPKSTIRLAIPREGVVSARIYDMLGREIVNLHDGYLRAGFHSFTFDGSHLTSGAYFCRIAYEGKMTTHKILLVK